VIFQLTAGTPAPATGPGQSGGGGGGPPQNDVVPWLDQFAQLLVEGIKFGSIIAITAVGLSLIFGTTGLINFAHGELVTLGATVAFMLNASVLGPQLQLIPAVLVTVAFGAAFGGALELGLWKPLRRRGIGRIPAVYHLDRPVPADQAHNPGALRNPAAAVRRLHDPAGMAVGPGLHRAP